MAKPASFTITAVDPLYLKVPNVQNIADGQQDSLLIRVRTDVPGLEGWGESDGSPLPSLAAYVCPMSHSQCSGIRAALVGQTIGCAEDIVSLHASVTNGVGMDLQQVEHAYSGCDCALWDALGKLKGLPVHTLLHEHLGGDGEPRTVVGKVPYASVLFGDTPAETRAIALGLAAEGFKAVKFGWGPIGKGTLEEDVEFIREARAGLGAGVRLCVDFGQAGDRDASMPLGRAVAFAPYDITWLEEPLAGDAIAEYAELRGKAPKSVPIAGGEASDNVRSAEDLLLNGKVDYLQIDPGRIGGLTATYRVRRMCEAHGKVLVNHTFKSHLTIAAALAVMATSPSFELLEFPQGSTELSATLVRNPFVRGPDGLIRARDAPGLGVEVDMAVVAKFLVPVVIDVGPAAGGVLYTTVGLL